MDDLALAHDGDVVGHGEGGAQVLLDQQDREALVAEVGQQAGHPGDHRGGEAVGGLVEQQQARVEQQGAGDGQHLLLPAGELVGAVAAALGELGEEPVDPLRGPRAGAAAAGGDLEVLLAVRSAKTRRPWGTRATPDRATRLAGRPASSRPWRRTLPAVGRSRPMTADSRVDLPAPLRPSRATAWPSPTVRSTPCRTALPP